MASVGLILSGPESAVSRFPMLVHRRGKFPLTYLGQNRCSHCLPRRHIWKSSFFSFLEIWVVLWDSAYSSFSLLCFPWFLQGWGCWVEASEAMGNDTLRPRDRTSWHRPIFPCKGLRLGSVHCCLTGLGISFAFPLSLRATAVRRICAVMDLHHMGV